MKKLGFDLILLGDPASGKDTQADILKKQYALKPVESGKHWRALAKKKNADGALLRRTMSRGFPTPVILMKKFIQDNLKAAPKDKNLIFIGNPRLKPEGQLLNKLLKEKQRDYLAIYIRLPKAEILKRAGIRSKAQGRSDDSAEFVKNRIKYYETQVVKTVKYFQSIHKLIFVNGNRPIQAVTKDIQKIINDYQRSEKNRVA
jgi:adenylate kinase